MVLDKFKELIKVKLGARNVGSDISIHRKRGDESTCLHVQKNLSAPY